MWLLRLFAVMGLMTCTGAGGFMAASLRYEVELSRLHREIERRQEEIDGYRKLADATLGMSSRSLEYAERYQTVLDTCLKFYNSSAMEPLVVVKGGVGGPADARGGSRLP